MPPDPNDCDSPLHDQRLIPLETARERMLAACPTPTTVERLPLDRCLGRVLATALVATLDLPPFANSAMDGYAVRSEDCAGDAAVALRLIGRSAAGAPFAGRLEPGTCLRILTGAALPDGADAVVIQEAASLRPDGRVSLPGGIRAGANVRWPGEDLRRGDPAVEPGRRLMPAQIAAAAALGRDSLEVWRRPRVAFFSTGDELSPLGSRLEPGQIFDSNRPMVRALLERIGVEPIDLGVVEDSRAAIRAALSLAAGSGDAVLTTGGVSVGDADYVREEVAGLGELNLWRIAMKPGKPLAFGRIETARFFGLPGNPVSALVTFYQLVAPALRRMGGEEAVAPLQLSARLTEPIAKKPGRVEFQRGRLRPTPDGELEVAAAGGQGSHVMSSLSAADCFIVLPAESGDHPAGTRVTVQPFSGLV